MASEIEASGEPSSCRDIELGTSLCSEGLEPVDGRVEDMCVEGNAIVNRSKFCNGCHVHSARQYAAIKAISGRRQGFERQRFRCNRRQVNFEEEEEEE